MPTLIAPTLLDLYGAADARESHFSLLTLIAIASIIAVYFLLQGTYFGLRLKAVGRNFRAAYLLGIPTWQYIASLIYIFLAFYFTLSVFIHLTTLITWDTSYVLVFPTWYPVAALSMMVTPLPPSAGVAAGTLEISG